LAAVPSETAPAASIPSVDRLLREPSAAAALEEYGREQVTAMIREVLAGLRARAVQGERWDREANVESILEDVQRRLLTRSRSRLSVVFNLTGTVLHTNLGRAPLPATVMHSVVEAMIQPVTLEFDLAHGRRRDRDLLLEPLLCELTGAEAATVVNNNAAAVLLMLHTLANRREVVVSRGELVEIGGAFRIPDVMRAAGAKLVEVGTTNRTHEADYAQAIGARTALLMKVHASNYAISGFTASVELEALAALGRSHQVPTVVDIGSGSLIDLTQWGLPREPTIRGALEAGADLVTFSGDKLLGGPQAGIIVGRRDLIQRLRKHPLKRALRVGKLTLAVLEGVLALYRNPERLAANLTSLRLLTRSVADITEQAHRLMPTVQQALGAAFRISAESMAAQIGSGALPSDVLPSFGLAIRSAALKRGPKLSSLDAALRTRERPIIGRIADDTLWLDLRCLEVADEAEFVRQWSGVAL
jgi:L-seryl-tRNA(Ser) seleniumtransferase